MKILFTLTPAFNPNDGGVQRTTWKLGKFFTEQGLEVFYFSFEPKRHVIPQFGTLYHAKESNNTENPINIKLLEEVLTKIQPDIVINQMPYYKHLRECLCRNKGILGYVLLGCLRNSLFNFKSNLGDRMSQMLSPLLYSILNNSIGRAGLQFRHWLSHRRDLKKIIDQHDYFILLAPPNREELKYFVGEYKSEKIKSIPNSIPEVFPGALNKKEKIILHVGRLNIAQKRSDLLLDFWEECHSVLPDWNYVIVGDGPYFKTLDQQIKERKLPRVTMEGYQKPEPYYERASVFVMPSAYEGFPNTLIEAQSYGCVPVAFNSYAALEWIVNHQEDAILCKPYDSRQMASSVLDLIQNNLKDYQTKALINAQRFTINEVGKEWLGLFQDVI